MGKPRPGTAVVCFQHTMHEDIHDEIVAVSGWSGTFVDRFVPSDDAALLLAQCWRHGWDPSPIRTAMLERTWRIYPEEPDTPLTEPVVSLVTESARETAETVFELSAETGYVVTIGADSSCAVWQQCSHPSVGDGTVRTLIDFVPTPAGYVETLFWLADMNPATKQVASKLRAIMRYESWSSRRHPLGAEGGN